MSRTPKRFTHTMSHLGAAAPLAFALMLAACGGDPVSVTAAGPPAASVTVSPAELTLESGGVRNLTATVKDAAGNVLTDRKVTWSSSNTDCVVVSGTGQTGVLTAKGPPGATISASVEGKTGSASITVVGAHL